MAAMEARLNKRMDRMEAGIREIKELLLVNQAY